MCIEGWRKFNHLHSSIFVWKKYFDKLYEENGEHTPRPLPPGTYSGNSSRLLNFMTRRGVYIVPWRKVIKKEESLREKVLRGKRTLVTV